MAWRRVDVGKKRRARVALLFLPTSINRGAQSDHCLHFVKAMAVAVDPSLAAVEVTDSIPAAEVAALERKADTAVDPSPAALVVAGSSPVAVAVGTADSNPDFPVAADSSPAALVAVVPSSAAKQLAGQQFGSLHARHAQCGHCECGARYTGLPTPPGQPGSRYQRYGSKVKGW